MKFPISTCDWHFRRLVVVGVPFQDTKSSFIALVIPDFTRWRTETALQSVDKFALLALLHTRQT